MSINCSNCFNFRSGEFKINSTCKKMDLIIICGVRNAPAGQEEKDWTSSNSLNSYSVRMWFITLVFERRKTQAQIADLFCVLAIVGKNIVGYEKHWVCIPCCYWTQQYCSFFFIDFVLYFHFQPFSLLRCMAEWKQRKKQQQSIFVLYISIVFIEAKWPYLHEKYTA